MAPVNKAFNGSLTPLPIKTDPVRIKQEAVLLNAKNQANNMRENVSNYYKRMAEFQEELAQNIEEKNNRIIQGKIRSLENMYFGNNVSRLLAGNNQIDSLLGFAHSNKFDSSLEDALYAAKKQRSVIQEEITKIQKGETDNKNVRVDAELRPFTQKDIQA